MDSASTHHPFHELSRNCTSPNDMSVRRHRFPRENSAYIEVAELRVLRTHFIESHLGDDALEIERIACEQSHSPFPGVEADRAGDDLLNPPRIFAPGHSMRMHETASLLQWKRIPVLSRLALLQIGRASCRRSVSLSVP